MKEAIAHFAEQDFYKLMYGPNGPLHGRDPASANIREMLAMSDEDLMASIVKNYNEKAGDAFEREGATADEVLKELFSDIAAHYEESLPPPPTVRTH
jgi:hypothetical protein